MEDAKKVLEEGSNYTYVVEATGEVLHGGGQVVSDNLRHDALCIRAAAFLKVFISSAITSSCAS